MRAQRRLALHKETLTQLQTADLAAVAAGQDHGINLAEPSGQLQICNSRLRPCNTYDCMTYGCPTTHCGG